MNFGLFSSTSLLGFVAMVFLFVRYGLFWNSPWWAKLIVFLICMGLGVLPQIATYRFESGWGELFPYVCNAVSLVYMTAIILATITVMRDAVWVVLYWCGVCPSPFSVHWVMRANVLTLIVACMMGGYALYAGLRVPVVRTVEISSPKIHTEYTIVALPDLHLQRVTSVARVQKIVDVVNAQTPDVILLVGDTIDDNPGRLGGALRALGEMVAPYGVFFVTGNHETYLGYDMSADVLSASGFKLLENSGTEIAPDLYIGGIPDIHSSRYSGRHYDLVKTFAGARDGQFRLLVSHTPNSFADNIFDFEIAGHTHGGQIIPIIFLMYLYTPFLAGEYDLDGGARLYVSRGVTQGGPQMRLFAPSEITVIKLKPAQGR